MELLTIETALPLVCCDRGAQAINSLTGRHGSVEIEIPHLFEPGVRPADVAHLSLTSRFFLADRQPSNDYGVALAFKMRNGVATKLRAAFPSVATASTGLTGSLSVIGWPASKRSPISWTIFELVAKVL